MRSRSAIAVVLSLLCGAALAGPEGTPRSGAPMTGVSAAPADDRPADFLLRTPDGRPVALKPLLGKKPVLLVFWATWCPTCIGTIPKLNSLHAGPSGGKVQVLGLDYMETPEKVSAAVRSNGIRYPVLLDENGKVARAYGVFGIPAYILIDRTGRIVYRDNVLPDDIERRL